MQTILITGGTGLIGTELTQLLLSKNYRVIILTRNVKRSMERSDLGNNLIKYSKWDIKKQEIDSSALRDADHIIHLAGEGIADKRWTKKRKQEILDSRVQSSRVLVKSLKEIENRVKTVVSASAIGWYGEDQKVKRPFVETDPADDGFLGSACKLWEESIEPVAGLGKRLVEFRTGIVLGNKGGAFTEFKRPAKFGIAPILGSGKQIISWIHIQDIARMYLYAIENDVLHGAFNAASPEPVSNKHLMLEIAKKLKGNLFIPVHVPAFALKLLFGEVSIEVLKSTTVSDEKIRNSGFHFLYPTLEAALNELLHKSNNEHRTESS